jgi:hypothetical protein
MTAPRGFLRLSGLRLGLCLRRFFPLRLKKDLSHCARISYRLCVKKHVACGGLFSPLNDEN